MYARLYTLLAVFFLVSLSCATWETVTPVPTAGATPTEIKTDTPSLATVTPTSPTASVACVVATGLETGRLNLRACGGIGCRVIDWLDEGESLTLIAPGEWAYVQTAAGVYGYTHADYIKCMEVK